MNLLNKVAVSVSTLALVMAAFVVAPAAAVNAASPGEVYSTPDGTVWFVTKDMEKRPFTSAGAFLTYGFLSFDQVSPAGEDVTSLPTGSFIPPQDGRIFCATETKGTDVAGECSLITDGMKAAFTSEAVFTGRGFSFDRAFYGDSSFLSKTDNIDNTSDAHRMGVQVNNGGTIQLIGETGLCGVPSLDVFNSWGYSFADTVPANAADKAMVQNSIMPGRMAGELSPMCAADGGTTPPPSSGFDPNGGTQGSIDTYTLGSRAETEALEGQNDVEIYVVDVELANDGPLMLTSADVWFAEQDAGTESSKPWDYFTEVSLLLNGSVLATVDTDAISDWSDDSDGNIDGNVTGNEYKLRFTNLNGVFPSDEISQLSVEVSMVNNLDTSDQSADWDIELGQIRVLDESGFTTNENTGFGGTTTLEETFTVGGSDVATLEVSDAEDEIDAQVIEVSESADTNGVAIYNFEIEETNEVDANITEMTLTFTATDGGAVSENVIMRRARLMHNGVKVGEETMTASGVVVFDNLDIDIDADATEEFTVEVDLYDTNSGVRYGEGSTITVAFTSIDEVTDANGNDEDDITVTGTPAGNVHELRTDGIHVNFVSSSAVRSFTADSAGEVDEGTFEITFTAEAFGDDARLDRSCVEGSTPAAGEGVAYDMTNDASNSTICNLTSSTTDAEDTSDTFELDEGVERTFTLQVVATPTADHFTEASLASINWGTATNNTNANYYTFDLDDFKTDAVYLNVF